MISLLDRFTSPLTPRQYLQAINPRWATATPDGACGATVTAVQPNGSAAVRLALRLDRSRPAHLPGQFVTVTVEIDGVRHQRCYSICSAPSAGHTLELTVGRHAAGTVSTYLHDAITGGDRITVSAAAGDFTLDPEAAGPLTLLSAGTGLTPIMSMLRALAAADTPRRTTHVSVTRSTSRQLFADELAELGTRDWLDQLLVVSTDPAAPRLSAELLDDVNPDWRSQPAYVCGPERFIAAAVRLYEAAGALDQLHLERFGPAPVQPPERLERHGATTTGHPADPDADPATVAVRLNHSSRDITVAADQTLLDAVEAAGLQAPFGCRNGVCHTCTTRLDSGCARNLRTGRDANPGDHIQLCVSTATTPISIDL